MEALPPAHQLRSLMAIHPFLLRLKSGRLISDGAMGTELLRRGLPPGHCPEEFNLSHPEIVREIYEDYYEAGSDLVSTNSFGGNRFRLKEYGLESRTSEFCKLAARIASEVRPDGKFIAGSIGPTGQILEPIGAASPRDIADAFKEQAIALAEGGVDLFIVETMMAVEEAELAIRAVKEATGLPVAATMTFELGPRGFRTMWGVDIPTAVQRLSDAGADIIGANCGRGFDEMIGIIQEMRPLTQKPILAQPNAGLPSWSEGKAVYSEIPDSVKPKVEALLRAGVNIIGGCCGTTPEHIRVIRQVAECFAT